VGKGSLTLAVIHLQGNHRPLRGGQRWAGGRNGEPARVDVGMGTMDARICALTSSVRSTGGGGGCGRGSGGEPAPPATLDASAGAQPHAGALVR